LQIIRQLDNDVCCDVRKKTAVRPKPQYRSRVLRGKPEEDEVTNNYLFTVPVSFSFK